MGTGGASSVRRSASAASGGAWKNIRSGPCNRARIDMHPTVPARNPAGYGPLVPSRLAALKARAVSIRRGTRIRLRPRPGSMT